MRKLILSFIIILFLAVYFINSNSDKEIRVRIIPNSDRLEDKELKNEVKKITIGYLTSLERKEYNKTIEEIKPCHLAHSYKFNYNTHSNISNYTHEQLANYTHDEIRNSIELRGG